MKNKEVKDIIKRVSRVFILWLILKKPRSGYEIIKILKKENKRIGASSVYPILKELKKEKLVEIKENGARNKKIYSITKKGKKKIEDAKKKIKKGLKGEFLREMIL